MCAERSEPLHCMDDRCSACGVRLISWTSFLPHGQQAVLEATGNQMWHNCKRNGFPWSDLMPIDWRGKYILIGTKINSSYIIHSLEGKYLLLGLRWLNHFPIFSRKPGFNKAFSEHLVTNIWINLSIIFNNRWHLSVSSCVCGLGFPAHLCLHSTQQCKSRAGGQGVRGGAAHGNVDTEGLQSVGMWTQQQWVNTVTVSVPQRQSRECLGEKSLTVWMLCFLESSSMIMITTLLKTARTLVFQVSTTLYNAPVSH